MGRWQSDYYDQVLGSKLKTLVCGAIARAKLDKDDPHAAPTISYESFVQDLDHGDSFTTTLVDILVKELAERKSRPTSSDRHLIAERTVYSLHNLIRSRVYRDRSSSARRPFSNDYFVSHTGGAATLDWDVLTQNDDEDVDVEEEVAMPATHRFNPPDAMYHPFGGDSSSNTTIRRSFPVQTVDAGTDDDLPTPPGYPSRRSPPAHFAVSRHSTLTRTSSIRRPPRTRTNDFNDFTRQRRLSTRQDGSQPATGLSSRGSSGESSSSMDIANLVQNHHAGANNTEDIPDIDALLPHSAFGPGLAVGLRGVRRARSTEERGDASGSDTVSSPRLPFTLRTAGTSTSAAPSSSRLQINIPRLRRGGVRPPEQFTASGPAAGDGYTHTVRISSPPIPGLMSSRDVDQRLPLLRRSSSAEMEHIIQTASERFGSRSPRSRSPFPVSGWGGFWSGAPGAGGERPSGSSGRQQSDTPPNLPTPRSISPEGSSTRRTN